MMALIALDACFRQLPTQLDQLQSQLLSCSSEGGGGGDAAIAVSTVVEDYLGIFGSPHRGWRAHSVQDLHLLLRLFAVALLGSPGKLHRCTTADPWAVAQHYCYAMGEEPAAKQLLDLLESMR
jgi:hypothetical protein